MIYLSSRLGDECEGKDWGKRLFYAYYQDDNAHDWVWFRGLLFNAIMDGPFYTPGEAAACAVKYARANCPQQNFTTFDDWAAIACHLGADEANRMFAENTKPTTAGEHKRVYENQENRMAGQTERGGI